MRLIDGNIMAEDESEAYLKAQTSDKISPITQGINSVVHRKIQQIIADTPTIDPETLPIVRELRRQLSKITAERNAAVEWLANLEVCGCCKNTQCRSRDGEQDCKFEWIGIQEVQNGEEK